MKNRFIFLIFSFSVAITLWGATPLPAYGQRDPADSVGNETRNTPNTSGPATLSDPLGLPKDSGVQTLIGRVISAALGVVGSLALLMFVYGGLLWMTSGGNDEKVKQGREILIWATAGLALVFFSYVLVRFVIQGLTGQEIISQTTNTSNNAAQNQTDYQTGN
jgi:hypothetical protein